MHDGCVGHAAFRCSPDDKRNLTRLLTEIPAVAPITYSGESEVFNLNVEYSGTRVAATS